MQLKRASEFSSRVDAELEAALLARQSLEDALDRSLPLLGEVGAIAVVLNTYDESLALRDFVWPKGVAAATITGAPDVFRHRLDVAGQEFGSLFAQFSPEAPNPAALLAAFAEQLDDFLAAIAMARRKFQVQQAVSEALKDPILDDGLSLAIRILADNVSFDSLILVYRHEEDLRGVTLGYKVAKGATVVHDSQRPVDRDVDAFIREHAKAFIAGGASQLLERFGSTFVQEEALINGVRTERLIGRLVVGRTSGKFSTHDRDLLDVFADYVRLRVADFNREWKRLSTFFRSDDAKRLLHEPNYVERFLKPRVEEIAILYTDITAFTRLAEEVLVEPARIGAFVDTWSKRSVEILWECGGVFDKMVGDCIIGLFGPPFFEIARVEACRRAAEAVHQIRAYTATLSFDPSFPELHGKETLAVSSGLNFCPVAVGLFGPGEDYTAFGSGMNNTARLQGQAKRGEILAMDAFVEALGDSSRFGPERNAAVKNVAKPLVFRELF